MSGNLFLISSLLKVVDIWARLNVLVLLLVSIALQSGVRVYLLEQLAKNSFLNVHSVKALLI